MVPPTLFLVPNGFRKCVGLLPSRVPDWQLAMQIKIILFLRQLPQNPHSSFPGYFLNYFSCSLHLGFLCVYVWLCSASWLAASLMVAILWLDLPPVASILWLCSPSCSRIPKVPTSSKRMRTPPLDQSAN